MNALRLLWDIPLIKAVCLPFYFLGSLLLLLFLPESLTDKWFPRPEPGTECDYDF